MQNKDREKVEPVSQLRRASLRRAKETAKTPLFPAWPGLPQCSTARIQQPAATVQSIRIFLAAGIAPSICKSAWPKPSPFAKSTNLYSAEPSEAHSSLFLSFFSSLATRHSSLVTSLRYTAAY